MWVVLKVSQVMVTMRPASAASEAVTSHGLFGVSKNIEGSIFRGQDMTSKLFSDLDLGGPDDLRSDLRGHLRPISEFSQFGEIEGYVLEALEVVEAVEPLEAAEAVEATEAIEAIEAVQAMEAVAVRPMRLLWPQRLVRP